MILNRYILKELVPQCVSTLIIFCSIIVISQLMRLSNVLVTFGLTAENILLPFLYIVVPFLSMLIPISYLFGVMMSFGRLSSDGEYVGMIAQGYSLKKMYLPVLGLSLVVFVITSFCAVTLEAWGRREFVQFIFQKTQTEIDNMIRFKIQPGVFTSDFFDYTLYTETISKDRISYTQVMLSPKPDAHMGNFILFAPQAKIKGSVAEGQLVMNFDQGSVYTFQPDGERTSVVQFETAEIDLLRIFKDKILKADSAKDDYRSYTPIELLNFIRRTGELGKDYDETSWRKALFLWHSRWAMPWLVFAFAIFGIIFGIQDQRQSRNFAYIYAVQTVIACFVFIVIFRWFGEQGRIGVWTGIWLPVGLLNLWAAFLLYQKHRLPPGEKLLTWRNVFASSQ